MKLFLVSVNLSDPYLTCTYLFLNKIEHGL